MLSLTPTLIASLSNHFFSTYSLDFKYYINQQNLIRKISVFNPYFIFGPFWFKVRPELTRARTPAPVQIPVSNTPSPSPTSTPTPNPVSSLTIEERESVAELNNLGIRIGAGLEIPLMRQAYLGIETSFYYVNLLFENQDLSGIVRVPSQPVPYHTILDRILVPPQPHNLSGIRFYGDMVNTVLLLGVNF